MSAVMAKPVRSDFETDGAFFQARAAYFEWVRGRVRPQKNAAGDWVTAAIAMQLAEMQQELAALRAGSAKTEQPLGQRFKAEFIEDERQPAESIPDTDRRLLSEYETLEAKRPGLTPEETARHRTLHENFYDFKG